MKVRKGECKRCGKCCRYLYIGKYNPKDVDEEYLRARGLIWLTDGDGLVRVYANLPCLCYNEEEGPFPHCEIYPARPLSCKAYPVSEDDLIPGCGYYFVEEDEEKEKPNEEIDDNSTGGLAEPQSSSTTDSGE